MMPKNDEFNIFIWYIYAYYLILYISFNYILNINSFYELCNFFKTNLPSSRSLPLHTTIIIHISITTDLNQW